MKCWTGLKITKEDIMIIWHYLESSSPQEAGGLPAETHKDLNTQKLWKTTILSRSTRSLDPKRKESTSKFKCAHLFFKMKANKTVNVVCGMSRLIPYSDYFFLAKREIFYLWYKGIYVITILYVILHFQRTWTVFSQTLFILLSICR